MNVQTLPQSALETLFQDAVERDLTTRRRAALLRILLFERYLTYLQLVTRVEGQLGRGCFGKSAAEDVFYRDMRMVKMAFKAAKYTLRYSRSPHRPGYYLLGQPAMAAEMEAVLRQSIAELDLVQMWILAARTPAERFRMGCSITDTALRAVAFRVRERNPTFSLAEASYFALQKRLPG